LITEHRETANVINEYLNELLLVLYIENYFLQYCKEPFSVTTYLQHKLKLAQPRLNLTCYASGKKQSFSDVPNADLFDTLKRWRDSVVEQSGLPIYMVANQNALKEIATYLPFTKKDLMKLSGFGRAKAEKYGDDILEAVMDYCSKNNLESNMAAKEASPKRERKEKSVEEKTPTNIISFNLFKEGKSVPEIAKERNMAISTIEGHLASFIANGEIDINKMISKEKQLLITEAAKIHGRESFKTLKDNLPENITYGEIRMVMAAEKKDGKT
jgi:ATP-dependent DNA helicase RecQ